GLERSGLCRRAVPRDDVDAALPHRFDHPCADQPRPEESHMHGWDATSSLGRLRPVGLLSFFKSEKEAPRGGTLLRAVRAQLPAADDDFVKTVAAVAGLLGQVAYVDRPYLPEEEAKIRDELSRVDGLSGEGLDAICRTLRENIAHIAEVEAREYAAVLRELS